MCPAALRSTRPLHSMCHRRTPSDRSTLASRVSVDTVGSMHRPARPFITLDRVLAVFGVAMGTTIAVVSHYLSQTSDAANAALAQLVHDLQSREAMALLFTGQYPGPPVPGAHPSWWPTLPLCMGIGLVAGVLIARTMHVAGWSIAITRRRTSGDTQEQ